MQAELEGCQDGAASGRTWAEDRDFPGCCRYPQLHSRSLGLRGPCSWAVPGSLGARLCQAGWRGCQPLEPARCPWLPGGALNPGLGSRPCSLPAPSLLKVVEQRVPRQPAEQVGLHLMLPLFLAPCFAWGHDQQPPYVPGLWGSHLLGYLDPGCCSAPSPQGRGAVCIGRSVPTRCVHPPPGRLTFDLGQPRCYGRPPRLLPLLCHLPALPLQLPVDHRQEGEEEGPENH